MFLDVACFFKGEPICHIERLLNACDIHAQIALRVLKDKSLITISNSCVHRHDLLQEMGRDIARQECIKEPGKRSRLWNHEDIYHVLTKNIGTEAVEGLFLDKSNLNTLHLAPTIFSNMNQIKFLKFHYSNVDEVNLWSKYVPNDDVQFPKGLASLPKELKYLQWHFDPLKCLPSQFHAKKLVELDNCVTRFGMEYRHLTEMPDLSEAKNLETMICKDINILRHMRHRILLLAHATIKQRQEFYTNCGLFGKQLTVILPGNKIPKWIQHQGIGDSIVIPLSSNWYHNFLGFVVSATFKLNVDGCMWVNLECKFKSNDGDNYCNSTGFQFEYCDDHIIQSTKHVFMSYNNEFYIHVEEKGGSMPSYSEVSFQFIIKMTGNPFPSSAVIKRGVQLLYNGDTDHESSKHEDESSDTCSFIEQEEEADVDKTSDLASSRKKMK
ncbi:hypothetical protein GH714_001021 [Hevea brasiliensis]|uniref:TMV resistance protein N n=1 Tax=Hevea brasiliensis TaxID=3981 RepID=A0A6A6K789_HEVBR|nr:hypothetical protein GH714_001021 [Hevea brasiliensis]